MVKNNKWEKVKDYLLKLPLLSPHGWCMIAIIVILIAIAWVTTS